MKSRKVKAYAKSKAFMSKKKLKGNLSLDTYSDSDADVNTDSLLYDERDGRDDELSTDDEDLIHHKNDSSSEEEVLPITDDDDEEEEEQEGWEDNDEEDVDDFYAAEEEDSEDDEEKGLPNKDSWGKKKSIYFNADFVDQDRGKSYREKDAEQARAEEEEALSMQKNFLDILAADQEIEETDAAIVATDLKKKELEKQNWKSLNKEGKLKYLKKKCPEVLIFTSEFKEKLREITDVLLPMLAMVKSGKIASGDGAQFLKLRYQLFLHYCTNVSFYMVLKSSGSVTDNHPVLQRINTYKKLIDQMNDLGVNANKEIAIILEKLKQNEEISFKEYVDNKLPQNERRKIEEKDQNGNIPTDLTSDNEPMDVNSGVTDEKRTITYEMAKNKGLTARRKKEIRNPRVRHRMKFKKAKIRRKGQVREVIKEVKRYDGEPTGISTHVVRSIKMK